MERLIWAGLVYLWDLWSVGSAFYNPRRPVFWGIGAILNMYVIACDIRELLRDEVKPLYRILSLSLAGLANTIFITLFNFEWWTWTSSDVDEMPAPISVLHSTGLAFYLCHSIFFTSSKRSPKPRAVAWGRKFEY